MIDLRLGDCLEILPTIPSGSVSAVVSDPPWGEQTHKGARSCGPDENRIDFAAIDERQCLDLCGEFLRIARRWVVFNCEWRFARAMEVAYPKEFIRLGIWVKPDCAPQFSGDRPGTGWEAVAILHRQGAKRWNGGGDRAVWVHNIVKSGTLHRTQKPIGLVTQWIRQFSDPGDLILDPFAGSGTTGVAALKTGRHAILIEKDERYIPIIECRLRDAETPLFESLPSPKDSTPCDPRPALLFS
jgi:site-specific DNA-methyltransferase (adenine-specific)